MMKVQVMPNFDSILAEAIIMWDDQKRQRFQWLRQREQQLSAAEQSELASLVKELETAEEMYLQPATERLRQERELLEKQNGELEKLSARKKDLAQRLGRVLADARAEQRSIETELAAVLAGSHSSHTDE
jgi:hypothetical protein